METDFSSECEAFGLVMLWLSLMLRLLSLSTSLGPLVLMFILMVADTAKWLTLMVAVIIAFASGFYSLFHEYHSAPTATRSQQASEVESPLSWLEAPVSELTSVAVRLSSLAPASG